MKKITIVIFLFCCYQAIYAQQNVIKLGLGSAFQRDIHLKYERAFAENHSVQLGILYDTKENLSLELFTDNPDAIGTNVFLRGYAFLPEYRYYFSKKGSPRNFYAGLKVSFGSY